MEKDHARLFQPWEGTSALETCSVDSIKIFNPWSPVQGRGQDASTDSEPAKLDVHPVFLDPRMEVKELLGLFEH